MSARRIAKRPSSAYSTVRLNQILTTIESRRIFGPEEHDALVANDDQAIVERGRADGAPAQHLLPVDVEEGEVAADGAAGEITGAMGDKVEYAPGKLLGLRRGDDLRGVGQFAADKIRWVRSLTAMRRGTSTQWSPRP